MALTGIRKDVFMDRYARKDDDGKAIETSPEQMWDRVAAAIAEVEAPAARPEWTARFRQALDGFKFVPGGRILAGAGTGQKVTFYNCLPPDQPVLTPSGYVPIAEVDVREFVVTGQGRARMVTQVFAREADEPLYEMRVAGGAGLLRLTGNHPVLARRGGGEAAWVRAAELGEGDLVGCLDAGARRAADAQAWHVRRDEPVGWSPRGGAQVLVRERRETYVGVAWRAIEAVERLPYCGTVYDLEVEEDHSFVTAGAIVSNCYVIPSPEDSRRGIMDSVGLMVEIMSRGGGVGVNLSSLRPRGSYVRGVNGTASGPVSWGEVYSTATGAVIQGGSRRGALMLMLDDDHPDVEEFITVKKDLNRINNANLSVCVSDRFMEAVKQDADWELKWEGKVEKVIHARDLWNLICESAWASGEPGVVFMERYQNWSNTWYCEQIRCVNPCFVGSTRIATSRGLITAEELYRTQEPLMVLTDRRALDEARQVVGGARHTQLGVDFRPAVPVFKTRENAAVWRVETEHGYHVTATADHRFLTPTGYVPLEQLREGDVLYLQSSEGGWSTDRALPLTDWGLTGRGVARLKAKVARGEAEPPTEWSADLGRFLGWVVADGYTYTHRGKPSLGMVFGAQEQDLMPYFQAMIQRWFGVRGAVATRNHTTALMYDANVARFALALGLSQQNGPAKTVPSSIWTAPRHAVIGFLQGLFTADGTVNRSSVAKKSCTVRLASSSADLLREVQLLLLNLGIVSRLHLRRPAAERLLPDSQREPKLYKTEAQWELLLDKVNRDRFAHEIGFLSDAKQAKVCDFIGTKVRDSNSEPYTTRVRAITPAGTADVFDTTEPVTHSISANGAIIHQCGEQGLGPWGVCNLGAINIAAFVKNKKFDWSSLRETVAIAMRFLDNVIDATEYYFVENERQQREGIRRTGLGSMGLADALIRLELRYGSPEAIAFCDKLYATVRDVAYRTSAEIAVEKGPFPAFDRDKYLQGHFIKQLPNDVRELIAKNGIRNGVLLTQAPTGTTSLLAGVSSGIEPVYAFSFKRVDRTGTHVVYHDLYQQWMEQHPDQPAPAYFVSADQLTPEEHVRMQAAIQKYVDSSISKTVNAPNAHTVEEVKTLYTLAYDLGCKGVTYFRDGCRTGVLTKLEDEKPKAAAPAEALAEDVLPLGRKVNGGWGHIRPIERPARLIGFTDRKQTPLGTLFLTLNTLDGHPVELFATIGKAGSDVAAFTEAIARLVSVALRSGVDPSEVASQLKGIGGSRSVGFGAARVRSVPDAIGQFIDEVLDQDEAQGKARPSEGNGHHNGHGNGGTHALKPMVEIPEAELLAPAGPAGAEEGHPHATGERAAEAHPSTFNLCPACGLHTLAYIEGCALCFSCGYSEC